MRSMLILTDFSEASFRAAEYSCQLTGLLQIRRIVLYHAYQTIVAATDLPVSPVKNSRQIYMECMESLGLLHDRLLSMLESGVKVDLVADEIFLPEGINQLCRQEEIDLIVMGMSGKSRLEKLAMGSTTARMMETCRLPLLIVPREAIIGRRIKTLVFATDLKSISTLPVAQLHAFLDAFKADVCVVNVETPVEEAKYSPEAKEVITGLHQFLDKYNPAFYYIEGDDVVKSLLVFAGGHKASLIVAVPKTHSFFSTIFHKSVCKKLAYNSPIPFLALPALQ